MAIKLTRDPTFSSVKAETLTADAVTVAGVALDPSSPGFSVLDVTAGTITGDKAVVVDASKNAGDFNNLDCVNLDAGKSGTAGTVDIFPTTGSKGKLAIVCSNQTGNTTVTVDVNEMGQATTVNVPDPGASASYVVQSTAALTLAEADVLDAVTAGAVSASKAVVVDSNKDIGDFRNVDVVNLDVGASGTAGTVDIFPATGSKGKATLACADQDGNTAVTITVKGMGQATAVALPDPGVAASFIMQMAAENDRTIVNATPAEINNACDVSARVQTITASGAVTAGVQSVELDHTTVAIAATIATTVAHPGLFVVKSITEPGSGQDHTVTITNGTWNGTNKVATFADINDTLVVYFDSAGNGTVVANVGSVALSG